VPEFLPQVPTDPFTGEPIQADVLPDQIVFYVVDRTGGGGAGTPPCLTDRYWSPGSSLTKAVLPTVTAP